MTGDATMMKPVLIGVVAGTLVGVAAALFGLGMIEDVSIPW